MITEIKQKGVLGIDNRKKEMLFMGISTQKVGFGSLAQDRDPYDDGSLNQTEGGVFGADHTYLFRMIIYTIEH
jgi:hypothetical protein